MKRIAVFILFELTPIIVFCQSADSLTNVSSGRGLWWLWLIPVCFIGYLISHNFKTKQQKIQAKIAQLEKEKRELLKEALKDKTAPFIRIKGITHYDPKCPGCYIAKLEAETSNQYDPYAVKVIHPTMGMIGHMPKGNSYLHKLALKKELYGAVEIKVWNEREQFAKFWIDEAIFTIEEIENIKDIERDNRY